MTFDREKIARAVADAQNVPFVGVKQLKIADAVIEAVRSEMTEEFGVKHRTGFNGGYDLERVARSDADYFGGTVSTRLVTAWSEKADGHQCPVTGEECRECGDVCDLEEETE